MSDLRIEKRLPAPRGQVFDYLTRPENLAKWWGPEGCSLPDAALDFTAPGPWHSVMVISDGRRFKVSGEVTAIDPPRSVEFTWGWHDEADARGPESRVRVELAEAGPDTTDFVLIHSALPDDDSRRNHEIGWMSSLAKFERQLER
jgi:uncharacterized protein YndB with AHSA1/START domain